MEKMELLPYQNKALEAIQSAFLRGQNPIVVKMATGTGRIAVLIKTLEYLHATKSKRILVVVGNLKSKEELINELLIKYGRNDDSIVIETEQRITKDYGKNTIEQDIIIFYDIVISTKLYDTLSCKNKTVIAFPSDDKIVSPNSKNAKRLFQPNEIIYSYTFEDAINDGYITPAMNANARSFAFELYSRRLLQEFGFVQVACINNSNDNAWDLVLEKDKHKVWVECKAYKSQVVSPSVANELLKTLVMRKLKQEIAQENEILLIVLSSIPSFKKDEIYKRYKIIVWDIENLVFYSKDNPSLLKQLSQITYFPIEHIKGQASAETNWTKPSFVATEDKNVKSAEEETSKNNLLIKRLTNCITGRANSREYEEICEDILRHLFETNYFNRLTSQHKTKDEHFRMDLIGSLKTTQDNDEGMHPFWQMLVQHYNSHFVVFEFKNYSEKIDQNLIYITEKYLFDAALRNVAFIISRKGFSDSAKFAAAGCLKEHGKLILDITQDDLIKMLKASSDNPADYLLTKLEDFLMGISK